jgi:hypothetical protein
MFYNYSGNRDNNWINIDETDPEKIMLDFFNKNCYVYDADNCGEDTFEFVFEIDGKVEYYSLYHSWYIEYDPDWNIENEYEITKIDAPKHKFPGNRDWLKI